MSQLCLRLLKPQGGSGQGFYVSHEWLSCRAKAGGQAYLSQRQNSPQGPRLAEKPRSRLAPLRKA
eukprot:scaffold1458_cov377-Prasinococcus_capsulatus_cf.AAC.2